MKLKGLSRLALLFTFVLVSYGVANSQIVDATKDAASKTKEVTVDAAKKTAEVTTDVADKTKDAAKTTSSGVKTFGNYTVKVTENIVTEAKKDGKWFMTTTWDGAKWVSKKVWYPNKKDDKEEDK